MATGRKHPWIRPSRGRAQPERILERERINPLVIQCDTVTGLS